MLGMMQDADAQVDSCLSHQLGHVFMHSSSTAYFYKDPGTRVVRP